jgi:hypothetical protein
MGILAEPGIGGRAGVIGTSVLGIVEALIGGVVAASVLTLGGVYGLTQERTLIAAWRDLPLRRRALHVFGSAARAVLPWSPPAPVSWPATGGSGRWTRLAHSREIGAVRSGRT